MKRLFALIAVVTAIGGTSVAAASAANTSYSHPVQVTPVFCVDQVTTPLPAPTRNQFPAGVVGNIQFFVATLVYNATVAFDNAVANSPSQSFTLGGHTHTITHDACPTAVWVPLDSNVFLGYPGQGDDDPAVAPYEYALNVLIPQDGWWNAYASVVPDQTYIGNGFYLHARVAAGQTPTGQVVNSTGDFVPPSMLGTPGNYEVVQ